jgi:hypothetical protein
LPAESRGVAVSCTVLPTPTLADAGLTVTDATGTAVMVKDDVPLLPSLVAVIVAEPAARAVTSPLALTLATPVLLLAHVTALPFNALPAESLGAAASWTVCPTSRLAVVGVTVTEATGAVVTVTEAVPLFPSLVAVIVAEPAAFAVTSPLALTLATVVLPLAHVTALPVSALPAESLGVAASCTVCPTNRVADGGFTVTAATGTVRACTEIVAVPLLPSLVAVIVAEPAAFAVTSPLALTLATVVLLLAHVTALPASAVPTESSGVAVSCTVPPTVKLAAAGVTTTLATGTVLVHTTLTLAVACIAPGWLFAVTV